MLRPSSQLASLFPTINNNLQNPEQLSLQVTCLYGITCAGQPFSPSLRRCRCPEIRMSILEEG
jgi:hypothetical protein